MFSVLRNLVVLSAKIITTVSGTGQGVRNVPFYCATLAVYFVLYNKLSYARILIGFHLWSIRGQMYRWCHHLNFFSVYFNSLLYKTNRFQVAMRLFSNRSQRTSKCGKNISDTLSCTLRATFLFLPHFDVIFDLLLNRCMATWNLFVN